MANVKNFAVASTPGLEAQIEKFANSDAFKNETIRIMPDGHQGKGAVVGSVLTYYDKIVPNVVGVDIACRVSLFSLGVNQKDLPEDFFEKFDKMVAEKIPTGFNVRSKEAEQSKSFPYKKLKCWDFLQNKPRLRQSMGTLGGGNHYLELDVDKDLDIYLSIHCGSRNLGKQVCEYYQQKAVEFRDKRIKWVDEYKESQLNKLKYYGKTDKIPGMLDYIKLRKAKFPEDDLCYVAGNNMRDYLNDMVLCNEWSRLNHEVIFQEIKKGLEEILNDN